MTTTRPMQLIQRGAAWYVENGPLLGPSAMLAVVTSRPGPRADIVTPVGVVRGEHTAYDLWTDELAIPGHEAPVVAMAPWKLYTGLYDAGDARGMLIVVEYPPLGDGRRVFGRSLHLDADRDPTTKLQGVKGDVLGYMGDTGPAQGEHLHQEVLVEHRPGLVAQMEAMGGARYEIVRAGNATGFTHGTAWVDWLTPGWLAYFNAYEWGESWPQPPVGAPTSGELDELGAPDLDTSRAAVALIRMLIAAGVDDATLGARTRTIVG